MSSTRTHNPCLFPPSSLYITSWFNLSSKKSGSSATGEVHIKVVYGDGKTHSKRGSTRAPPPSTAPIGGGLEDTSDSTSSDAPHKKDSNPLQKSGNWQKKVTLRSPHDRHLYLSH